MRATPALPNMQKSQTLGRIFVAVSLVVFGVQHFMYGGFVAGLVPAFMPGRLFWAYFVGVAFFAAAAGILYKLMARPAATMLGVMFFLFVVLLHIPRIVGNAGNGNEWTSGFVALAMCGGAWILANAAPLEEREKADPFLKLGRYFFALAFVFYGTAPPGLSDRRRPRSHWHSNHPREKGANRSNSAGNDPFCLLPVDSCSAHRDAIAQSRPLDKWVRDPGSVRGRFGPEQQLAERRSN